MTGTASGVDGPAAVGRPRSREADHAILAAALELVAEHGYAGATTDAVARRAGVSKATLYRRWRSKDDLVVAAVGTLASEVPDPDTGTLAGDLRALARALAAAFARPRTARLVGALVDEAARRPELADALRSSFLDARREVARRVLERARTRGDMDDGPDPAVVVDLLAAPFYYRILVSGEPVDAGYADGVVDAIVAGIGVHDRGYG